MPVVPRAERRVESRPIAGAQVNPRAPEAAFAPRPLLPDLSGVQKVIEEERLKADQVAVLESDNKLAEKTVELQRLALSKQRKDAMGATAEVREEWDKTVGELEPELTSERAKMMFRQRAQARWSNLHSMVEAHAASEGQKFDNEQTTVALSNRHNDALTHYQEPARVAAALDEQAALLRDFGKRNGMSDEVVAEKIAMARSAAHVGILDRMLSNGQDRLATAYFAEHKAEIQGEKIADVEKALEVGSTLGESMRQADEILFGRKPASSRSEAFARARAIDDPKLRKATEDRLDTEFSRRDREERDRYDDVLAQAAAAVDEGKMPAPGVMAQLKLGHQQQIKNALKRAAAGTAVHTDPATMYQLLEEAGSTDPSVRQKFAQRNLVDFLDKLSTSDFEQLAKQQIAIKQGKPVGPEVTGFVTGNMQLRSAIKGTKLKEGTPEYVELQTAVLEAQKQELESSGRKTLTPEQTQRIIDRLVVSHFFEDRIGPDPAYRGAQLPRLDADQRGRLYVPIADVPKAELDAMRKRAREKLGVADPLERDLERAWAAALQGDLAGVDRALRGSR